MILLGRRIQAFHGHKFLADPPWEKRLASRGIAPDQDWTQVEGDELVSQSGTATRCYRMVLPDGETVYFKRYVYSFKKWLEFWLRPGKCAVETWAYGCLHELGIPSLDVVAFAERRILGMLVATCIVTRAVPDTQELGRFAIDTWYHLPEPERRHIYKQLASQLVVQVRKAHQGGFYHHDLKWRNILVRKEGDGYSLVWIDAPRASRMHFRQRRGVVVDLSGLARIAVSLLSKYDRMRFVRDYLGDERHPGDAKRLYREVASHLGRRPPRPLALPPRAAEG
ncbi:lipopolysaccharide kinase InaA family protein [Pseudomonadota bacterium]